MVPEHKIDFEDWSSCEIMRQESVIPHTASLITNDVSRLEYRFFLKHPFRSKPQTVDRQGLYERPFKLQYV
jgi:hypothetical protein